MLSRRPERPSLPWRHLRSKSSFCELLLQWRPVRRCTAASTTAKMRSRRSVWPVPSPKTLCFTEFFKNFALSFALVFVLSVVFRRFFFSFFITRGAVGRTLIGCFFFGSRLKVMPHWLFIVDWLSRGQQSRSRDGVGGQTHFLMISPHSCNKLMSTSSFITTFFSPLILRISYCLNFALLTRLLKRNLRYLKIGSLNRSREMINQRKKLGLCI